MRVAGMATLWKLIRSSISGVDLNYDGERQKSPPEWYVCEAWNSDLSPEFFWMFLCTQEKSLWFLEWTIWVITVTLVADRQHGPKRISGTSPLCLRTSACGRAHWPFLTQNSFVWLHLFLQFSLTGPFLSFVLLPLVPSLLLDAIWSYSHKFKQMLPSH